MSKFFTYEERLQLQKYLKEGHSFKHIARTLYKDPTTISREIKKHMFEAATGYPGASHNTCRKRLQCRIKKLCSSSCTRASASNCKFCPKCNIICPDFLEELNSVLFGSMLLMFVMAVLL